MLACAGTSMWLNRFVKDTPPNSAAIAMVIVTVATVMAAFKELSKTELPIMKGRVAWGSTKDRSRTSQNNSTTAEV